jgi:translation initiation factor 1A
MPKNVGIGGKKKKMGKKRPEMDRELVFKEEMQEYAQVLRLLGDSRLELQCMDTVKRMGHIRGNLKKKAWITCGDVVLVSLREYENDKCDIILKYTEDEVRKLKQSKEIPDSIKINEENNQKEDAGDIEFFGAEEDSDEENTNKNKKGKKKVKSDSDSDEISEEDKELDIDNI